MSERDAVLNAVLLSPRCMVARGAAADWLEDHGEPETAEAVCERRLYWPYRWETVSQLMWAWFPDFGPLLRAVERPAALPRSVWRHLRASKHDNSYAVVKMYYSEDDALDALSEAAAKAFGLVEKELAPELSGASG